LDAHLRRSAAWIDATRRLLRPDTGSARARLHREGASATPGLDAGGGLGLGPAVERPAHLLGLHRVVADKRGGDAGAIAVAPGDRPIAAPAHRGVARVVHPDGLGEHERDEQLADHALLD